jgi:hypothetical protein
MKFLKLSPALYRHAELLCGLVLAACAAMLMAIAGNPGLAAIAPNSTVTEVVYAEFALMACVIAGGAMLHARGHGRIARTALWLTTALWWASAAVFFDLSSTFALIGTVASLACVASIGVGREEERVMAPIFQAPELLARLSLYGDRRAA